MKRNQRIGALIDELTAHPNIIFGLKYFCGKFDVAKSSLSEDIVTANEAVRFNGNGGIVTISGANGGVMYVPGISDKRIESLQDTLCKKLEDPGRILGGGFLYTSDIMFDSHITREMALVFAKHFQNLKPDYVATIETKGIPLASAVAYMLGVPLIVIRREAKYSEGSTVSINYFSGSYDRIQKMSISKRAVIPSTKALIIDDFMRAGGSLKGITEILSEFEIEVIGIGVAIADRYPEKKKVKSCFPIIYIDSIDEDSKTVFTSKNISK